MKLVSAVSQKRLVYFELAPTIVQKGSFISAKIIIDMKLDCSIHLKVADFSSL